MEELTGTEALAHALRRRNSSSGGLSPLRQGQSAQHGPGVDKPSGMQSGFPSSAGSVSHGAEHELQPEHEEGGKGEKVALGRS